MEKVHTDVKPKFCHVGSPVSRIQFLTFKFAFLVQKRIQIDAGCGKEI